MPSISESVEMWMSFIAKIAEKPATFNFWFRIFKTLYLPVLFPSISKEAGIKPATPIVDSKTFKVCPPQLQEVLATGLAKWIKFAESSKEIFNVLWPAENGKLIMALCRYFCSLPIEYATTTSRIIEKFREFLFVSKQKPFTFIFTVGSSKTL